MIEYADFHIKGTPFNLCGTIDFSEYDDSARMQLTGTCADCPAVITQYAVRCSACEGKLRTQRREGNECELLAHHQAWAEAYRGHLEAGDLREWIAGGRADG